MPPCVCACACGLRGGGRKRNASRLSLFPKEGGEGKQRRSPFTVTIYHHHCHHHHCSLCSPCPPKNPKCPFFFLHFLFLGGGCLVCILGCADFRFSCNAKRNRTNIGRRLAWLFVFAPLFAGIQRRSNEKRHFVELIFFIPCSRFEVPPFRLLHTSLSSGKANAHLWLLLSFPFHASCVT
ncbi:hypothetical protein IscW_ISCW020969 [Ixodes scapularis]|uniref:Uncharacterized protein n=1 Tax=Ixodes scapularis TaxID=6945 RepID=B7Q8Z2_IXOSC|nr:hypothetical protein IscW_ISCW020969 [Ixodes scapularis]|eukprot:XP_002405495.1 hypothetical protein IscW_ISCW020969 [Ixodes scapularis]